MAILEVTDIHKRFGGEEVLKGISFSLEQGDVLVIIGASGSGKTTLLRCLNFLETRPCSTRPMQGRSPSARSAKTACTSGWCSSSSICSRSTRWNTTLRSRRVWR